MMNCELHRNSGYRWHQQDDTWVKGYLFDEDGNLFQDKSLFGYFKDISDKKIFQDKLEKASGLFSIVIRKNNQVFFAVDNIRMFPLFWFYHNKMVILTDDLNEAKKNHGLNLVSKNIQDQFLATGYVLGSQTLLDGVHQLMAGQYGIIEEGKTEIHDYTLFCNTQKNEITSPETQFKEIVQQTFRRLIRQADGRTIAIPLSGGYDSRLIAVMLKKLNYSNVICFSYGRQGNIEAEISKKVAKILGYPWHMITYTDEIIKDFLRDKDFLEYYPYSSNYSAQFFFQEYFAIRELKRQHILPDDALIVPGHSGDFLAGSHLYSDLKHKPSTKTLARNLWLKHFVLAEAGNKKNFYVNNIAQQINNWTGPSHLIYENWDWRERQAKYIVNSTNVYNYYGFQHALPMWEKSWFEFFRELPFEQRFHKQLYDTVCRDLFAEFELNLPSELQPSRIERYVQEQKNKLKSLFYSLYKKFKKHKAKPDLHFYDEITNVLTTDLKHKGQMPYLGAASKNSIVTQWYLHTIRTEEGSS